MVQSTWEMIGTTSLNGIDETSTGFPIDRLQFFLNRTQLPGESVFEVLQIEESDLQNRVQLSTQESERLWRIANLYRAALNLFDENQKQALEWLQSPHIALNNNTPLQYATTEPGAAEIQDLIGRIEHGVFS